jgi:hypothetical protein
VKKLCGKIHNPKDGGAQLITYIKDANAPLLGVSDASLKNANCSHAWIITSNNPCHIQDPNMMIHGSGSVNGLGHYIFSVRGEIQRQTAAAIIIQQLLWAHNSLQTPVPLFGDNHGIQNKCNTYNPHKLKTHRVPNKLHVKIIQDLKAIFLTNLQDIHGIISSDGATLMQGFYAMQYTHLKPPDRAPRQPPCCIQSIISTTKVALVPASHYDTALTQLSAIHSILASYVPLKYHKNVFVASLPAGIAGHHIDSVSS